MNIPGPGRPDGPRREMRGPEPPRRKPRPMAPPPRHGGYHHPAPPPPPPPPHHHHHYHRPRVTRVVTRPGNLLLDAIGLIIIIAVFVLIMKFGYN